MKNHNTIVLYAAVVMISLFALTKPVDVWADINIPAAGDRLSSFTLASTDVIYVTDNATLYVDATKTIDVISIASNKTLTLIGEGNNKLTIRGVDSGLNCGLIMTDNVILEASESISLTNMEIKAGSNIKSHLISATYFTTENMNLEADDINGTNIEIKAGSNVTAKKMVAVNKIEIKGGTVNVDASGINADGAIEIAPGGDGVYISGGTVMAKGNLNDHNCAGIRSSNKIVISGGIVDIEANEEGISADQTIEIKGNNTVVKSKGSYYAILSHSGITIDDPMKIIKPQSGGIGRDGVSHFIATTPGGINAATDVEIRGIPDKKDDNKDEDSGSEWEPEPKTVKASIVNKNVIHILSITGLPYGSFFAKQEQGLAAKHAFAAALPSGYKSAFTFNMITNGHAPDYSLKKGKFTILIPAEYRKAGRTFALQALDKNGKVILLPDKDTDPDTLTVEVNLEGYAFELIYKD